ncbi:MAG: hypothetical protein AAFR52_09755 [Pseudomonadota bacterium]
MRWLAHAVIATLLTVLTQLGGVAWLVSRALPRPLASFAMLYAVAGIAALWLAPLAGRVPLSCLGDGPLSMQSPLYCVLNRQSVDPVMAAAAEAAAEDVATAFPGTVTLALDASFPFVDGFPLLPHLSHDDGAALDLAFYYRDAGGYAAGATPSPIGYFAFEPGPTDCPDRWPTLRWDLDWLQPLWPAMALDEARLRVLVERLAADDRVDRMFLEPHLARRLDVAGPKLRFQGCRAARHDDHLHVQR